MTTAEQPYTAEALRAEQDRAILIERLRAMATWLEDNPAVPVTPWADVHVSYFDGTCEEAHALAGAVGLRRDPIISDHPDSSHDTWVHPDSDGLRNQVAYQYHVRKATPDA